MTRLLAAAILGVSLQAGLTAVSPADPTARPDVKVQSIDGAYSVEARFTVAQPPASVIAVLTDYDQIPRYMPNVTSSKLVHRDGPRATVEQKAVTEMLMFSKEVHLRLDIVETDTSLRFRDVCGKSFARYEGAWSVAQEDGTTVVRYALVAKPAFRVPGFVVSRLMKRDSSEMIERLRLEIAARGH